MFRAASPVFGFETVESDGTGETVMRIAVIVVIVVVVVVLMLIGGVVILLSGRIRVEDGHA